MKKVWIFLLVLVLCLGLCACQQNESPFVKEYTFPEGTSVLGTDMTGLTKADAWSKLQTAAAGYALELTVDGVTIPVSAEDIDLSCSEDHFLAAAAAMEAGASADLSNVVRFNEGKLRAIMNEHFNKDVTEAAIIFDEAAGAYVMVPHADGQASNPNALVAAVKDAICTLTPSYSLSGVSEILHPVRRDDAPELAEALELANKMIGVELSYTFNDSDPQPIPAETIRSFVMLGEDGMTPVVNDEALDNYVKELSDQHSIEGSTGPFHTTGGGTVDLTVSYNGVYVDNDALKQDIITCMQEGISETRTAPYLSSGNRDLPYGGTYIEVNLSSQHLWFYKNGERLLSTSLVSGKVAADCCTPTGIYSIYAKKPSTYLTGEDYRSFVNYWMPFHGGYGLHDATWRGSFGGDIYLYNGSHGCVNLPLKAAATIYNNAPVGTKVILYGGKRSVPPLTQSLTGTTSYDVADDVGTIKLNIRPKYSDPELTYSSSNSKVASVDASGNVTIKSVGKATITVKADKHESYSSAETTVTINVHSACDEGRHTMGSPTTVTAPTCQPGAEKITCTKCGHSTQKELKPVKDHSYGQWVTTKEPTCSAEGTKERTCTICNTQKETGTVPATGNHTEGDWVTTKEPTCVAEGTAQTKCKVCGTAMNTKSIAATGVHTPGDWKTVTDATCTANGKKAKFCTVCDKELETGEIPAGHKPGDWETSKSPTCTEEGTKVKKCSVCKEVLETASVAKKDHSFNGNATCSVCGAENPGYVPPTSETTPQETTE